MYGNIKLLARSASIRPSMPLSQEELLRHLTALRGELKSQLPDLQSPDKEDSGYRLLNPSADLPDQRSVILTPEAVQVLWAHGTPSDVALKLVDTVSACFVGAPQFDPSLLAHVDTQYFFDFETNKNHYEIIHNLCYADGALGYLRGEGTTNLTNDIEYRLLLDQYTVMILRIIGGHADAQVAHGKLETSRLRVALSVGRTGGFAEGASVSDVTMDHVKRVDGIVEKCVGPHLIRPLGDMV